MLPIRTILHPTDFSEQARQAFILASALARDCGAHLIVLHVAARPLIVPMEGVAIPVVPEGNDELRQQLESLQVAGARAPVTHELVEGSATSEILRVAEETKADMIVMGTHGRRGLGRLLLGSIAENIVRKAPCPVLTVRQQIPAWTTHRDETTETPHEELDPGDFWPRPDAPRRK